MCGFECGSYTVQALILALNYCLNRPLFDSQSDKLPMITPKDIYALIIGIDDYWERPKLLGAVNDATEFEEHLKANGVPSTNITKLLDNQATRAVIIRELKSLAKNTNIEKDKSAIIIFFAGHGASSPAPPDWPVEWRTVGGQVEQLCSVDIQSTPGNVIEGIPDYTIRLLLDDVARAKGNNITMFLDCCHAAGMNRDVDNPRSSDLIQRSIGNAPPLSSLSRSDSETGERPNGERPLGALTFRESHIQVAACSSNQKAHECSGHGLFTAALMKVLRAHPFETLTYRSLMHRLALAKTPETAQTPLCDGIFIRRRLFDSMSPEADPALILCNYDRAHKQFILMAGSLLGVTAGSEYKIFDTDLPDLASSESALSAIVDSVKPYQATLYSTPLANGQSREPPAGKILYARLSKATSTELRLYCRDDKYLADVLKVHDKERPIIRIIQVSRPADADLVLILNDEKVSFERGLKTIIVAPELGLPAQLSGQAFPSHIPYVRRVVDAYAWFLYRLSLTWPILDGKDLVQLSFKRLTRHKGKIELASQDLLENSGIDSDTTVYVDPTAHYGLTVHNTANIPLFVYIFNFCPDTLKIQLIYMPQSGIGNSSDHGDALKAGQILSLGYGSRSVIPVLQFTSNREPVDVSLLKIFVSARAMNDSLGSLVQKSPFETPRGEINTLATLDSWDDDSELEAEKYTNFSMTKIITVVQRKEVQEGF